MGADEAPRAIVEHEDRWLFKPLRGRTVTRIEWKSDHLELVLDDNHFRILVGYDTELSARSLAKGSPDRHRIDHWNRVEVEEFLGARMVSAVFHLRNSATGCVDGTACHSTSLARTAGAPERQLRFGRYQRLIIRNLRRTPVRLISLICWRATGPVARLSCHGSGWF